MGHIFLHWKLKTAKFLLFKLIMAQKSLNKSLMTKSYSILNIFTWKHNVSSEIRGPHQYKEVFLYTRDEVQEFRKKHFLVHLFNIL